MLKMGGNPLKNTLVLDHTAASHRSINSTRSCNLETCLVDVTTALEFEFES